MRTIARLLLGLAGLAAVHALARIALRSKDPQGVPGAAELTWLLVYVLAAPAITKNTPKTNATKARVDNLVSAVGATNTAVSAVAAGNTGFASANGYGATSTANVGTTSAPDSGDLQSGLSTSGQIGGAAAHTHTLPFLLPNADHTHDFGGHTHDFGGHNHPTTT